MGTKHDVLPDDFYQYVAFDTPPVPDHNRPDPQTSVYICAPYAGDIETNVARAEAIARYAVQLGYSPVVVHSYIEQVFGDDDDPHQRQVGLSSVLSLMLSVCYSGGHLWVVNTDNHGFSAGCLLEYEAWENAVESMYASAPEDIRDNYYNTHKIWAGTWDEWLPRLCAE